MSIDYKKKASMLYSNEVLIEGKKDTGMPKYLFKVKYADNSVESADFEDQINGKFR
jgi:HSP90 family molecular chaperone